MLYIILMNDLPTYKKAIEREISDCSGLGIYDSKKAKAAIKKINSGKMDGELTGYMNSPARNSEIAELIISLIR